MTAEPANFKPVLSKLRILFGHIAKDSAPSQFKRGYAGRSRTAHRINHQIAGGRGHQKELLKNGYRLLGRVPRLFATAAKPYEKGFLNDASGPRHVAEL